MLYQTKNIRLQFTIDLNKKTLSLIQINGVQNRFIFEHKKLLGFYMHNICS